MSKKRYYTLDKIKKHGAIYNVILGKRSNGKTYSVLDEILRNYCNTHKQGAILRRFDEDIRGKRGNVMFNAHIDNNLIEKYTNGLYDNVIYKNRAWYFCINDPENNKIIIDDTPFCYAFSLSAMEHDKSTSYPNVTTIIFDEFISRNIYLVDEFMVFMNCVSTIVRDRTNVTIYMLGNTVNKFCPYFNEMGLNHILNMKQGDIDIYTYGNSDLKVAVEYCVDNTSNTNTNNNHYFAFDNPKLKMITTGAWELDIYPHLPFKYKDNDIMFKYFIVLDNNYIQCEIIRKNNTIFTYCHYKTSELKDVTKDVIFSRDVLPYKNTHTKLQPYDNICKKILWFYKNDKVFYQSNDVGEIVRNYIIFSNK